MENYQIILDKEKLIRFIDWLPELLVNETYIFCLFARNKYCKDVKHISSDKAQVKRFTSPKERILNKIEHLQVPVGSYTQFRKGEQIIIPQEALAVYMTLNPRDNHRASFRMIRRCTELIESATSGFNLYQEALSTLQKTSTRKLYFNVDFDIEKDKFEFIEEQVLSSLNKDCLTWLETRGGFHLLVKLQDIDPKYNKTWYKAIRNIEGVELRNSNMKNDTMIPVPGTYQGGFCPKLFDYAQS